MKVKRSDDQTSSLDVLCNGLVIVLPSFCNEFVCIALADNDSSWEGESEGEEEDVKLVHGSCKEEAEAGYDLYCDC